MVGNPNHGKDGKFSSGPSSGHNAGGGNRAVAAHVKKQHEESSSHKAAIKEIKASWNQPISTAKAKRIKDKIENEDLHAIARQHDFPGYQMMMTRKRKGK